MRVVNLAVISYGWLNNIIWSTIKRPHSTLYYVVESADWVINQMGIDITKHLNTQRLLSAQKTTTHKGIHNQIIHFGSRGTFLPNTWEKVDSSSKIIFTWFHGTERDKDPGNLAMGIKGYREKRMVSYM